MQYKIVNHDGLYVESVDDVAKKVSFTGYVRKAKNFETKRDAEKAMKMCAMYAHLTAEQKRMWAVYKYTGTFLEKYNKLLDGSKPKLDMRKYNSLINGALKVIGTIPEDKCMRFYASDAIFVEWVSIGCGDSCDEPLVQLNGDGSLFVGEDIKSVDTVYLEEVTSDESLLMIADVIKNGNRLLWDFEDEVVSPELW